MENENGVADTSNTAEEAQPNGAEEGAETSQETAEESVEEVKARLKKAEELAENYKIRAEKAEKKSKEHKEEPKNSNDLSSKDIIAITKANVADEDLDEVIEYAKFKKISVSEALKSDVIKSTLQTNEEHRRVAQSTNTGSGRRGSSKISDEALEANAKAGKLPESDDEIQRLLKTRMGLNKK